MFTKKCKSRFESTKTNHKVGFEIIRVSTDGDQQSEHLDLTNTILLLLVKLKVWPTKTDWWFGTFFIFPYVENNHPNWLIFFRGVETTNQKMRMLVYGLSINPVAFFSRKKKKLVYLGSAVQSPCWSDSTYINVYIYIYTHIVPVYCEEMVSYFFCLLPFWVMLVEIQILLSRFFLRWGCCFGRGSLAKMEQGSR